MFLHNGGELSAAINFVGRSPGEKFLLDESQFIAGHVLKREFVAQAQGAAIDIKQVLASFILDAEFVAPREELLFHHVAHRD